MLNIFRNWIKIRSVQSEENWQTWIVSNIEQKLRWQQLSEINSTDVSNEKMKN